MDREIGQREIENEKEVNTVIGKLREQLLFFDGGTGSLLQEAGLKPGELPETFNIKHPEVVTKLHRDYLESGCHIIKTNTFGANRFKYNENEEYSLAEIVTAALDNAKAAVRQAGRGLIALDLGPTGKLLKPLGELDFEETVEIYKEMVEIGAAHGADLILIETMSDTHELKAAVLAAKENSSLPVFATVIYDERGKLLTGANAEAVIALLEGLGVDALGINCGLGPVQMKEIVGEYLRYASVPIIVNPNAGLPRSEGGKTVYDISAEEFAGVMAEIVDMGISVAGGCCGTTPEHIRCLVKLCKDKKKVLPERKGETIITSYAMAVEIGRDPVIIGERINPTGKARFKQALRDHDMEYILREAAVQQDNGAQVLDVNVGLPELDEASMMTEVITELQSITELPLQIDTSDMRAMEQAMRIYNGKPLVNSVNGKAEVMDAIFPLVKHYGGVVVGLTLDESGIPETAEGRIAIAEKIYKRAAEFGIDKKDILIDALCMTVSSDSEGSLTTLETVKRVRQELGGKTILGVSNISFGLPQREIINATFFSLALMKGLSAAIINPNSESMMNAFYSYRALADLDDSCQDYIARYGGMPKESEGKMAREQDGLSSSVKKGLKEQAAQEAKRLLETVEPLNVIQLHMIPALDAVGKGFEQGTVFLPQLLMSAEAAKAAFDVIKGKMEDNGTVSEKKGKILLATVKGDIHDIGKNIVKVLLENYGYEVVDMGKDVDPSAIAEEVVKSHILLVGLSALMTTTVPSMELTIQMLREQAPWARIMVGGAVLTLEYAKTIGADIYCRDAMASVNYAQQLYDELLRADW